MSGPVAVLVVTAAHIPLMNVRPQYAQRNPVHFTYAPQYWMDWQPEHCEGACLSQTAQVDMLTNGRGRGTEATGCRLFVGSADSGWCAAENAAENIVHSEIMFPFLAITLNKQQSSSSTTEMKWMSRWALART